MAVKKKSKGEERRWKTNEETRWKLHENIWLGDCPLIDPPHSRCYKFFFVMYEFSRELIPFLQLFVFSFIVRENQNKYCFEKISDKPLLALRKLVGSTFNIENNDLLAISMFLSGFHIQHCLSWWKLSSCYCFQQSAQALVRAARVQTGTLNETSFFAAFMIYDSFCVTHHTGNRFCTLRWLLIHGRYSL